MWRLIELGARTDTPKAAVGLVGIFKIPRATLPDSPIYPFKVKVWLVSMARQDVWHSYSFSQASVGPKSA
ncbi:hypothetical protein K6W26_01270 [Burkholderia sp. AU42008]|uniref:hypothetical protein n=1 Tax=unclassified Burkholderia TaxID=2613784 RepID=UPI0015C62321|nr:MULTISPECIES: hypothetical protein [unclassified Burkholderia]MBR8236114.1 hypothetical protein [Burkholderia sp. AU32357]MBY4871702.1 hypothetical protein [Burkholderia sp. AU42008]